jgi:hypothetical protein
MIKLEWNPPRRQLSQFGWFSLFGFALVGGVAVWRFDAPWTVLWVLIGVGAAVFGASRIDPRLVRPVFVGLMLIAVPIGIVISFVLIAVIYYLMVTPFGLVFRALGKDPLSKRPDPTLPTYWHERGEPRPAASYLRLY